MDLITALLAVGGFLAFLALGSAVFHVVLGTIGLALSALGRQPVLAWVVGIGAVYALILWMDA